jgi:CspA family cold shock protein
MGPDALLQARAGTPRCRSRGVPFLTVDFRRQENVTRVTNAGVCREDSMATGIVKWFNDAKGFGFIEPEAGGEDIFAHFSAIQMDGFRTLKQGGRVRFEVVQGPKGQLAQNIAAIDESDGPESQQPPDAQAALVQSPPVA